MQLIISGKHLELTDALKQYTQDKFSSLSTHFDKIGHVHIVLEAVNDHTFSAECTVNLVPQHTIHVSSERRDMYEAIDDMVKRTDRLVLRHKETLREHRG